MSGPVLTDLAVAADGAAWAAAGFSVASDQLVAGSVRIAFVPGRGIVSWAMAAVEDGDLDGLETRAGEPPSGSGAEHPNGVIEIDHVVVATPSLERTRAALEAVGIELRRVHEGATGTGAERRLGFFRVGRPIFEVVEAPELPPEAPARFWGITFTTADIDAAAELLGERLGRVKDAVQPGRRIATFRREAGLGLPVALISPTG